MRSYSPRNFAVYKSSIPAPQQSGPFCSSRSRPPLQTNRARASSSPPRSAALSSPSTSSSSSSPSVPRVFIQVTPLEGLSFLDSGPAKLSPHAVVVLEMSCSIDGRIEQQVFAFDFLPREPQRLETALALFSGKPVEAVGRERHLARVPKRRCVLVCRDEGEGGEGEGEKARDDARLLLSAARARLRSWDATPLLWRRFDCTHAAVELAAELAGVEESAARAALERVSSR